MATQHTFPERATISAHRRFTLVAIALLVVAAWLAYANSFSAPLILDDWVTIQHNPSLGNVWPPWLMFAPPESTGVGGRPVANATFVLNYAATGLSLRGLHAVNLAIHIAAAIALFGVVRRTLRLPSCARYANAASGLALAVAALWALHPVQTESVTYVSQRTESLMGMFYFLTLYAFIRSVEGAAPRRVWQTIALISCVAGMATKEGMVTVPVMIFLYDAAFVTGSFAESWRLRWRFFLGLAASWLLLAALMRGLGGRGVGFGREMNPWSYLMIEGGAIVRYLLLALWPGSLVFDYGSDFSSVGGNEIVGAGLVALAVGWTIYRVTRMPARGFLAAWFFVSLAPTSSVVPIPLQPISENRVYVPLAAIVVAVVLLLHRGVGRRASAAFVAIAIGLIGLTHARNADYRSDIAIWADTAAKRPTSSRAHNNLGHAWLTAGRLPEARAEIEAALRLNPSYADAHANFASVLGQLGEVDAAIAESRRAIALDPRNASAHYNLGVGLSQKGDVAGAIAAYEARLRLPPPTAEAEGNLALMLVRAGRAPEALPHAIAALRLNPNAEGAVESLGAGLVATRRFGEAVAVYETLLRQQPGNANARYALGLCLAQLGRSGDAAAQFQAVLQLDPQHAPARAALDALKAARSETASPRK